MKYRKQEAKEYSTANMKGVWAAAMTPFAQNLGIDEAEFRSNLRYSVGGVFVSGKQGEYWGESAAVARSV